MFYLSLSLMLVLGFLIGFVLEKIHLPGFVGMIVLGVLLGPTVLNLLSPDLLGISSILRQVALVVLTRSGLNLDFRELRKVGHPAILMCFVPATFEIVAVGIALSMGLPCGGTILAIAVLPIIITAPIGGFLIDIAGKKWLSRISLDTETVNQTNKT